MQIKKVGVIGCGLMGHGIAQVAAQGGCDVVVVETEQKFLDTGLARIDKSLAKLAEKAKEKGGSFDAAPVLGKSYVLNSFEELLVVHHLRAIL